MGIGIQSGSSRSAPEGRPVEAAVVKGTICEETVRVCLQAYGEQLRAIVLTGSLARDEATIAEFKGRWELWGDAEFFLVFNDSAPLPPATNLIAIAAEINSSLLERKARCHVSLDAVHSRYFREILPHIFAYELRAWGKTVWGDSTVLALIPEFPASAIPLEDAWRLLCNRVIEQLEISAEPGAGPEVAGDGIRYRTAKLYLDMATSYLLFKGAYAPTYHQRAEALGHLEKEVASEEKLPFSLPDFAERVADSTHFKLTGSIRKTSFLNPKNGKDEATLWKESLSFALGLWRWELAQLAGIEGNRPDRELMRAWMQRQPFSQRLRGWLYVARQQGWARSWADWPRWARLAWHASPRYWVYALTFELARRSVDADRNSAGARDGGWNFEALRDWLPATRGGEHACDPWHQLSSQTVWNYHEYLETTRA